MNIIYTAIVSLILALFITAVLFLLYKFWADEMTDALRRDNIEKVLCVFIITIIIICIGTVISFVYYTLCIGFYKDVFV